MAWARWRAVVVGAVRELAEAPPSRSFARHTPHAVLLPILHVSSWAFHVVSWLRALMYSQGLLEVHRLPATVISVGNVTWGGSGKTPMVENLVHRCLRMGASPAVLTRGYHGGDEVTMMQSHFKRDEVQFGVGADRVAAAQLLLRAAEGGERPRPPSVFILDDGLQYRRLHRDLEVVMVNAVTGWGSGYVIPRGPLREKPEMALRRADVVLLHHADMVNVNTRQQLLHEIRSWAAPTALVAMTRLQPSELVPVAPPCTADHGRPSNMEDVVQPRASQSRSDANTALPTPSTSATSTLKDAAVLCMSGIGSPASLVLLLRQLGATHVECCTFNDHHLFSKQDLAKVRDAYIALRNRKLAPRTLLVLTEKDYARSEYLIREILHPVNALVIKCSLHIDTEDNNNRLDELLHGVCRLQT